MARGSCWHPADACDRRRIVEDNNYIDMKQEMADRITHAWEYMCECLQIGRRETENAYVLKAFGGKVSRSKNCSMVVQSFTNVFALATTRKEVHVTLRDDSDWHSGMKNEEDNHQWLQDNMKRNLDTNPSGYSLGIGPGE